MIGRIATASTALLALPMTLLVGTASTADDATMPFDPGPLDASIPPTMLAAYLDAAETWGVDWALLAAVGKVECDHGRAQLDGCNPIGTVNVAGARGPMQFLASTWRADLPTHTLDAAGPPAPDGGGYATDGDGDGIADPWSTADATHAAARYLTVLGATRDPWTAARSYNAGPYNPDPTADAAYADLVTVTAAFYHQTAGWGGPGTAAAVVDGWALPLDPVALAAAAVYRRTDATWLLGKTHHSGRVAADIPAPVGTPIRAIRSGTVVTARMSGACGLTLVLLLDEPAGATVTHCHLSTIVVRAGTHVDAGTVVGTTGGQPGTAGAGSSTGPHLHLHLIVDGLRRCLQPGLVALWTGTPLPTDLRNLPTSGCTHGGTAGGGER